MIDYELLGKVLSEYLNWDYKYVETPWLVTEKVVRGTLPEWFEPIRAYPTLDDKNCLVGSAEQGFLSLDLPYDTDFVSVTPCFRNEPEVTRLNHTYFMKIELFRRTKEKLDAEALMYDARRFMQRYCNSEIRVLETTEGFDLTLNGYEIGSYGFREHIDFGSWAYGTGLALPRFSQVR